MCASLRGRHPPEPRRKERGRSRHQRLRTLQRRPLESRDLPALPNSDVESIILDKAADGTYKADRYAFNNAEQALYVDGKKAFVKE